MPHRLEVALKPELLDAEGEGICQKAKNYFGIDLECVRTIHVLTIDADLTESQLKMIQQEIFTNPVIQISSFKPLSIEFDWIIWVGFRPGVRDNPGSTAVEAVEDLLEMRLGKDEAIYTSKRYCLCGSGLTADQSDKIAAELLANDIIQQWKILSKDQWDPAEGMGMIIPKVRLDHTPTVVSIPGDNNTLLKKVSDERNLALHPNDIPIITAYFQDSDVKAARAKVGLSDPTDVELEYISQARSDHCNHNTFRGRFNYVDHETGESETVDNLFKTCIEIPTLELKKKKPWVVSVLWDNAGAGRFDENHFYVITGETHNSPPQLAQSW
jgi:phosphoribosylformylglycinamidine synthase